jgi:hypothetical protein
MMTNFLKHSLVVLLATAVFVFAFNWTVSAFGFRSIFFAFLANWLVISWVAILGQVISFTFSPNYYQTKPFEHDGRIYERLGVHHFKKLVRRGPLTFLSPTLRKGEGVDGFQKLLGEMQKAETAHVVIFAMMLLLICYSLVRGWIDAAGWLMLFNIIINAYPVMLQRYNRIKLQQKSIKSPS